MLSSSLYSGDGRPPLNQRVFDSSRSPGSFTQHGHAQRGEVLSFALLSRPKDRTVLMHTANFSPRPSRNSLPLHRSYRLRRSFLAREEGRCLITITNYLVPFYSTSLTRKKIYLKKNEIKIEWDVGATSAKIPFWYYKLIKVIPFACSLIIIRWRRWNEKK